MKQFLFVIGVLCSTSLLGNGIVVSGVTFDAGTNELSFTLTWENSWTIFGDVDLIDGAWVYIKYAPNGGDTWYHANMLDSVPIAGYNQYISYDDLGLIVYSSSVSSGTFGPQEFTVELAPLMGGYQDFKVFATEMVFINQSTFYAGDGVSQGRFYADGDTTTGWLIDSESAVTRGDGQGEFDQVGSSSSQGLSADFPKGRSSIFCMKYKITAQQYMDFLNCLSRPQQDNRVQADLSGTTASNKYVMTDSPDILDRNPIACDVNIGTGAIVFYLDMDDMNEPNSPNDGANVVLNHLTAADILAYMDWSGLRPITELEYEKICRGDIIPPVTSEYAWGTDTYNPTGSTTSSGTNTESTSNVGILSGLFRLAPLRAGYAATSTSSRTQSGATYWGIMDIHNLGEFMYGVESANFSRFSYGDGALDDNGNSDVSDWTSGAQFLITQDPGTPAIEPISQGKNTITGLTRSAYFGARGVRRVYPE